MKAQPHDDRVSPDRAPVVLSEQTIRRICNEYLEMPGLRLTLKQAQRLWGLDEETCASSLSFLVDAKFLTHVDNVVYARLTDGAAAIPSFRMAKANLGTTPRAKAAGGVRPRGLRPLIGRGGSRGLP